MPSPRVLISYAQGDAAHSQWIADLAARLRADGLDAIIDQYDPRPAKPWVDWVNDEFRRADWILLACTPAYRLFYEGKGDPDVGRGVRWEANLIQNELSANKLVNRRFVPILPTGGREDDVPQALRGFVRFKPDEQYAKLLAILRQPPVMDEPNASDSPLVRVIHCTSKGSQIFFQNGISIEGIAAAVGTMVFKFGGNSLAVAHWS